MIVRAWHATATAEGADAYREHFTRAVLPALQPIDGYHGAYLLRRDHDGHVELQVLTVWDSLEAIRRFAGADLDRAVVEPDAQAALASYDTTVTHHSVLVDTVSAATCWRAFSLVMTRSLIVVMSGILGLMLGLMLGSVVVAAGPVMKMAVAARQ